jgi:hypothetical protein
MRRQTPVMLRTLGDLRAIRWVLAAALLLPAMPLIGRADDELTSVENVRFEVVGELVYIYYDLLGPENTVHGVRISLLRETDVTFSYRPVNIVGDVGTIVFPGERRRITWDFTKEFPEGLTGSDYYFVVEAEAVQEERINPIVWIGGGAAVGIGLLVFLLSGGSEEPPPPSPGFPAPVGRP